MGTVVRIPFEVTGWEPEPLDLGGDGTAQAARGVVLPGTATGELSGLRGTLTHEADGAVLVLEYGLGVVG